LSLRLSVLLEVGTRGASVNQARLQQYLLDYMR